MDGTDLLQAAGQFGLTAAIALYLVHWLAKMTEKWITETAKVMEKMTIVLTRLEMVLDKIERKLDEGGCACGRVRSDATQDYTRRVAQ